MFVLLHEKLAKKLNQSGGSLCEVLSKDLPGRLRQRDFTCAVDPDTNKTINHILQYIFPNRDVPSSFNTCSLC